MTPGVNDGVFGFIFIIFYEANITRAGRGFGSSRGRMRRYGVVICHVKVCRSASGQESQHSETLADMLGKWRLLVNNAGEIVMGCSATGQSHKAGEEHAIQKMAGSDHGGWTKQPG